jgi:hypothetical protein
VAHAELVPAPFSPPGEACHVLLVAARHPRAALLAIEGALGASRAQLYGLTLKPVGAIVEAVLRLKGLDDREAEGLATRLAAGLGVQSVRVEHQWALK